MKQTIVTTVHFSSISTLNMTFYRAAVCARCFGGGCLWLREIRCVMVSELPWALLALQFVLLCVSCYVTIFVVTWGWWDKDVTPQPAIKTWHPICHALLCHWQQHPLQAPLSPRTPSEGTTLPGQDSSSANEKQRMQPGFSWVSFRP